MYSYPNSPPQPLCRHHEPDSQFRSQQKTWNTLPPFLVHPVFKCHGIIYYLWFVCLSGEVGCWATPNNVQELLLALCTGIISNNLRGDIYGAGD